MFAVNKTPSDTVNANHIKERYVIFVRYLLIIYAKYDVTKFLVVKFSNYPCVL